MVSASNFFEEIYHFGVLEHVRGGLDIWLPMAIGHEFKESQPVLWRGGATVYCFTCWPLVCHVLRANVPSLIYVLLLLVLPCLGSVCLFGFFLLYLIPKKLLNILQNLNGTQWENTVYPVTRSHSKGKSNNTNIPSEIVLEIRSGDGRLKVQYWVRCNEVVSHPRENSNNTSQIMLEIRWRTTKDAILGTL